MTTLDWIISQPRGSDMGSVQIAPQLFGASLGGGSNVPMKVFAREDNQNHLDARRDDHSGPVSVYINFLRLPGRLITKYFGGNFQDHLIKARTHGMNEADCKREQNNIAKIYSNEVLDALVIEDFGCTGLGGPVDTRAVCKNRENGLYHKNNSLTCFLQRSGESGKSKGDLGAAGLGRHVYYMASEISSKLIYTVPEDLSRAKGEMLESIDVRPLFFGQAILPPFVERGGTSESRFGSYHFLSNENEEGMPQPFGLEDSEMGMVEEMRAEFKLKRKPKQTGTSIVIPFPKSSFTPENITNAIAREFSMPVLTGEILFKIGTEEIDRTNIAELSDEAQVNAHNAFLGEALAAAPPTLVVTFADLARPLDEDHFNPGDLEPLAASFNEGALASLDVILNYGPRPEQKGTIRIAIKKTDEGLQGRHVVARTGLLISDYSGKNFQKRSNALVQVRADQLGADLREVETASHFRWVSGDMREHRCPCAAELITFITTAAQKLEALLANRDREEDFSIFADLLSGDGGNNTPSPPPPSRASPFTVVFDDQRKAIQVAVSDTYDVAPDALWRLTMVYDSVRGSGRARRSYRTGSFDLRDAPKEIEGGLIADTGMCHVDVEVADPEGFRLDMGPCDFATWADVRFRAELIGPGGVQ
jgi:hypothetical protein